MTLSPPISRRLRPLRVVCSLGAALALAGGVSACGAASDPLRAENEGDYVRVGHLKYQVQLSRQLNPTAPEDTQYLQGLTPSQRALTPSQAFFAVWVRVENPSAQARNAAAYFEVADTVGRTYDPIKPDDTNQYAYVPELVAANGQLPDMQSHAFNSPPQGALLLFKVDISSYEDRPLELAIADDGSGQTGHITLDV